MQLFTYARAELDHILFTFLRECLPSPQHVKGFYSNFSLSFFFIQAQELDFLLEKV